MEKALVGWGLPFLKTALFLMFQICQQISKTLLSLDSLLESSLGTESSYQGNTNDHLNDLLVLNQEEASKPQ